MSKLHPPTHRDRVFGLTALALAACAQMGALRAQTPSVDVAVVAEAMTGTGDVADDAAIWVHPADPTRSVVIGVNKSSNGRDAGLFAFDLDGSRAVDDDGWEVGVNRFEPDRRYNNVDVRYGFAAGGERWDLVCASDRTEREIDVFRVRTTAAGDFAGLEEVGEIPIGSGYAAGSDAPYGLGLFRYADRDVFYALISDKEGRVGQYRLDFNPGGTGDLRVVGVRVAGPLDVTGVGDDSEVEGIVGDDERGVVYIAGEDQGIYRYATDADGVLTGARVDVATVGGSPALTADVEGLALYERPGGEGYLVASVQGRSEYAVFERRFSGSAPNAYVDNFAIAGVEQTDGLTVTNVDLGGPFAGGMLVVHDGFGDSPTRYKFVGWDDVAAATSPGLAVDTRCDPRAGCPDVAGGGDDLAGRYLLRNRIFGQWLDGDRGGVVDLNTGNDGRSQQWDVVALGDGSYRLANVSYGNNLRAFGEEGVDLTGATDAQTRWDLAEVSPGTFTLRNRGNGEYLDGERGLRVGLSSNPGPDDEWVLTRVTSAALRIGGDDLADADDVTSGLLAPNPASDELRVDGLDAGATSLTLVDALGRSRRFAVDAARSPLDISGLDGGVYAATVAWADGRTASSVLVVRR